MSDRVLKPLFSWRGLICESNLDATARHVALTLSLHTNERGESCFPSLETLAKETARSKSTVLEALQRLENAEWIMVRRPSPGRGHRTEYRLAIPTESGPIGIGTLTEPSERIGTENGVIGTDSPVKGTAAVPEGVEDVREDGRRSASRSPNGDWRDAVAPTVGRNLTERDDGYGPDCYEKPDATSVKESLAAMRGTLGPTRKIAPPKPGRLT